MSSAALAITAAIGAAVLAAAFLMISALRQIRVQRRLHESEIRIRSILEAAQDAFVAMDTNGRITAWNKAAQDVFGWERDEVVGRELAETLIPPEHRDAHRSGLQNFLATGEGPVLNRLIEVEALHRDGHRLPVELAIWAVEAGDGWDFNAFLRDVTERKVTEAQLAAAHQEALEASRLKSEFLANMSHEIRTPMNGVIGMTGLLLNTELTDEQREYSEIIRNSSDALLQIINDILDFSKIEAGRLDIEVIDFNLRSAVEEVAELLAERAHAKGLELAIFIHPDVPASVRGDPGRLRQVLVNLAGNAVKFTDEGEVVISARVEKKSDEATIVRFEVKDTGIGLTQEQQTLLFQSFSQADMSSTRKFGGTGLGLAISKQLAELMGGTIGVESEPGRGSTFWFTVSLSPSRGEVGPRLERHGLDDVPVLVVDDNATNRFILEQTFLQWGMRPVTAEDGARALSMLRAASESGDGYPLVILDYHMPEMDGIEVARAVAADASIAPARMVMLTSTGQRGEAQAAHKAGVDAYLTKPVRASALFDCVATVLGLDRPAKVGRARDVAKLSSSKTKVQPRVLVVEDNSVNQKVAVKMLENLGCRADVAANGLEALEAVERAPYSLILMDCQMPEMDGYSATAAIRKRETDDAHVPIVAMTAAAMEGEAARCLAAGMDDYLAKPVRPGDLADALERWLPDVEGEGPDDVDTVGDLSVGSAESPIDRSTLESLRRLQDATGDGLLSELATLFAAETDAALTGLRSAAETHDARAIADHAHKMAGSSGNIGAHELAKQSMSLEAMARSEDLATVDDALDALEAEYRRVLTALEREFH